MRTPEGVSVSSGSTAGFPRPPPLLPLPPSVAAVRDRVCAFAQLPMGAFS